MTKRIRAKHKIDRRLGENIWGRPKSPVNRRESRPGQHGERRDCPNDHWVLPVFLFSGERHVGRLLRDVPGDRDALDDLHQIVDREPYQAEQHDDGEHHRT